MVSEMDSVFWEKLISSELDDGVLLFDEELVLEVVAPHPASKNEAAAAMTNFFIFIVSNRLLSLKLYLGPKKQP